MDSSTAQSFVLCWLFLHVVNGNPNGNVEFKAEVSISVPSTIYSPNVQVVRFTFGMEFVLSVSSSVISFASFRSPTHSINDCDWYLWNFDRSEDDEKEFHFPNYLFCSATQIIFCPSASTPSSLLTTLLDIQLSFHYHEFPATTQNPIKVVVSLTWDKYQQCWWWWWWMEHFPRIFPTIAWDRDKIWSEPPPLSSYMLICSHWHEWRWEMRDGFSSLQRIDNECGKRPCDCVSGWMNTEWSVLSCPA